MTRRDLIAPAAALSLLLAASPSAGEEACGICHPENRVAFEESIHAREEVSCTSCHGGDPETREVEAAHRGDFRSLGDRLEVPELCAGCHSDLDRMRPYNLPVDQYAVYRTSQHGRAVSRGDRRAAVCSDCHGTHEIRPPSDPASSVHPRRVAATCGRCHGDSELMSSYDIDSAVVEEYRASIHGLALVDSGNAAAPNCTSCHGVHGPTPPGVGDVDKVCGACHEQTRRAFVSGPHYRGMKEAGLPECASCHSNHAIRRFRVEDVGTLCADCHGSLSAQESQGEKLHTLLAEAGETVTEAEQLAVRAERAALHVEDHLSRIEEARTYITEALPLVHAVSMEPVERLTRRVSSIGEEVQHEIYAKLDRGPAHIGLAVFWFYVLMTLAILFGYRRRLSGSEPTS